MSLPLKAREKVTKERTDWDERANTVRRKSLVGLWLFAVGGQAGHQRLEGLLRLRRVPLSATRLGGFPRGGSDSGTRRGILERKIIALGPITSSAFFLLSCMALRLAANVEE